MTGKKDCQLTYHLFEVGIGLLLQVQYELLVFTERLDCFQRLIFFIIVSWSCFNRLSHVFHFRD